MNQIDMEQKENQREDQMSARKLLNELKRDEKQRKKDRRIRIKKIKSVIPWAIFIGVVIGGIYWVANTAEKSSESRPGEEIPIVSREHINVGDPHEPYNSNPPTSGAHAGPLPWGFSEQEVADEDAIHNLEHGGIWISYKGLDQQSIDTLREIARENSLSVVVSPREANDSPVAVASWGRLTKLDNVDWETIVEFIRKNKNQSPERLAR
jgi:hypothetical protein